MSQETGFRTVVECLPCCLSLFLLHHLQTWPLPIQQQLKGTTRFRRKSLAKYKAPQQHRLFLTVLLVNTERWLIHQKSFRAYLLFTSACSIILAQGGGILNFKALLLLFLCYCVANRNKKALGSKDLFSPDFSSFPGIVHFPCFFCLFKSSRAIKCKY